MGQRERKSGWLLALPLVLLSAAFGTAPGIVIADESDDLKAMIARKNAIRAGRAKAQTCTRCHGRNGIHQLAVRADWQDSDGDFAIARLRAFREGTLSNEVMNAVAAPLSDEDMVAIGVWLDSLKEDTDKKPPQSPLNP